MEFILKNVIFGFNIPIVMLIFSFYGIKYSVSYPSFVHLKSVVRYKIVPPLSASMYNMDEA